jgi:hypothetical protein
MFKRMYLEITNVCNLRCAFCPGTQRPRRFMTPEEFRQLAARLRPYGTYLMLHVMGEPLLHPQLAELLDIAGALDFRVCLVTNGTLLPRQLPTLEGSPALHKLSVSLHSFEGNGRQDAAAPYLEGVWQAAQLMPVTLYCSMCSLPCYFISFCSVATSSSITSSLPSRMSCATQVRMWLASSSLLKALTAALTAADWIRMSGQ